MAFNSIQYFVLLAAVVGLYWALRPYPRPRVLLLLAASYFFYSFWDWRFSGLLALSTVVDYLVGRRLERTEEPTARKRWLVASLCVNLGILGFFKYFNFFVDTFVELADRIGFEASAPTLRIILPVGISFYTFQTMSYVIDVYYRRIPATKDFLAFATFVAFFPQLVAGPIERAGQLVTQFERPAQRLSADDIRSGLALILLGLFKKVAIADALAPYANEVFQSPQELGWVAVLGGVYAFAFQIYADFSAYSDIARGSARLLGVRLVRNFEQPYLSRSITEFWRTWHISLSQWLRDYLYIPLGGNRKGPRRTMINLFLTMLLGGLWHGAAWTFVFWGVLHGTFLAVHRMMRPKEIPSGLPTRSELWKVVATFNLVCFAWVFFRADGFGNALDVLGRIFSLADGPFVLDGLILLLFAAIAMTVIDIEQRRTGHHVPHLERPTIRGSFIGVSIAAIVLFAGQPAVPFIYFQF